MAETFVHFQHFRVTAEDYGVMGLRYGSGWLSAGVTVMPFAIKDQLPRSAWLVSKLGRLNFGVQYEPQYGSEDEMRYKNKLNRRLCHWLWSRIRLSLESHHLLLALNLPKLLRFVHSLIF